MKKIQIVEVLRGVAALGVTMFHFCDQFTSPVSRFIAGYGFLGVDIFFVISGFVIPLSLLRSGYSVAHFPLYLARRLVRLEPPYVFSVLLAVALAYLSSLAPGFAGQPPNFSLPQIAAHFFYLIPLTRFNWVNPVYWTLAYEFCFYICAGLLFPFVQARHVLVLVALGALAELAYWGYGGSTSVLIWEFVVGALLMRSMDGRKDMAAPLLLVLACLYTGYIGGVTTGVVVSSTAALIYVLRSAEFPRLLLWLGGVSYSLYLVHVPIGGRVINLGKRLGSSPSVEAGSIVLALVATLLVAMFVSRYIERPALAASRRIG